MAQVTIAQRASDPTGGNVALTSVTAGRMLVYIGCANRYFGATPSISSVSGGGATWTARQTASLAELGVFFFTGVGTSGGTVTMATTGTYDDIATYLFELDANASDYDVGAGATGSSASASSGATAALNSDEDLALGAVIHEFSSLDQTVGGSFTEEFDVTPTGEDVRTGCARWEVTSASAVTNTWTIDGSSSWACAVITIKAAGGAAATSLPPTYMPSRATRANLRR